MFCLSLFNLVWGGNGIPPFPVWNTLFCNWFGNTWPLPPLLVMTSPEGGGGNKLLGPDTGGNNGPGPDTGGSEDEVTAWNNLAVLIVLCTMACCCCCWWCCCIRRWCSRWLRCCCCCCCWCCSWGCLGTVLTTMPGGIWMTAEDDVEPTWAIVALLLLLLLLLRTSTSKSTLFPSFDFAGDAQDVYFGETSSFGLISTSKLLEEKD